MESKHLDDLILLKIFSYLPSKILIRSMRVCKKWNQLIKEEIEHRKNRPGTILFKSESWSVNNFMDMRTFCDEFDNELNKLHSSPSLAIFFLNRPSSLSCFLDINDTNSEQTYHRNKRIKIPRKKYLISNLIKNYLNENVPKLFIYGDGIVGTKCNLGVEIESDYELPAFSSLFIPKNSHYRFSTKPVFFKTNLPELKTGSDLENFLGVESDEELKFLLILIDGFSDSKLMPFLNCLNEIRKSKNVKKSFACSGGIIKRIDNNSQQRPKMIFLSLISKLNSNVKVSQIMIRETSKQEFKSVWDEKINLMQKSGVYSQNESCLGFQVSCCGRGKEYHDVENFESNLFIKTFPKIPLVGFFGYGEIGVDYLPDYNSDEPKDLLDDIQNKDVVFKDIIATGFTSIFTLISLQT